jgi:hypothetical protein
MKQGTNKLLYLFIVIPLVLGAAACVSEASKGAEAELKPNQNDQRVTVQVATPRSNARELQTLLATIRDSHLREREPEKVTKAIERLGQMRAAEAVEDLAQLLTFEGRFEWQRAQTRPGVLSHLAPDDSLYPATTALFQIGEPALPALVKVLEAHETNSLESTNATTTIKLIFRERPWDGVAYLREAASKSATPAGAQRLYEAAARLAQRS